MVEFEVDQDDAVELVECLLLYVDSGVVNFSFVNTIGGWLFHSRSASCSSLCLLSKDNGPDLPNLSILFSFTLRRMQLQFKIKHVKMTKKTTTTAVNDPHVVVGIRSVVALAGLYMLSVITGGGMP